MSSAMISGKHQTAIRAFLFAALFFSLPPASFPWGRDQHQVVGEIAEENLTPEAKTAVARILGSSDRLSDVATWADQVKHDRRDTAPWHYINYPLDLPEPDYDVRDTKEGNIVAAIENQIALLKDPRALPSEREEALKFLVHFVGDIHQPLHCGLESDRGGNTIAFYWKNKVANLHSFWDSAVLAKDKGKTVSRWAAELQEDLTPDSRRALMSGGPYEWMVESRRIVKDFCYPRLRRFWPFPTRKKLSTYDENVISSAQAIAREQLLKAGLRLANTLNDIFAAPPKKK